MDIPDHRETLTAEELIQASAHLAETNSRQRRMLVTRLVKSLLEYSVVLEDAPSQQSAVAHLCQTLQAMAESVANADDATFAAMLLEAAILLLKLDALGARRTPLLPH
ncbi:hypothetical protein B5K06_13020 [Rhizobium grahamii]|uniref:Uncharacterized protein n=2 Tax=Rhizobium grahamii TaxID=1120045 RepID=A0A370KPF0_9HYPH|nr:hypothetical protein B5K06_13020 [Rhizobium grahamii]